MKLLFDGLPKPKKNKQKTTTLTFKEKLKNEIVESNKIFMSDKLSNRHLLILLTMAIWLANIFTAIRLYVCNKILGLLLDVIMGGALWVMPSPFFIIVAFILAIILSVIINKFHKGIEAPSFNASQWIRGKGIKIMHYSIFFLIILFDTFILSIFISEGCKHIFGYSYVIFLYNGFLFIFDVYFVLAFHFFDYVVSKLAEYNITLAKSPLNQTT